VDTWELIAREQIRDALATYNWSGDAFRLDDLAAVFCENGVLELRRGPKLEGRDAIVSFLSGVRGSPGDPTTAPVEPAAVQGPKRMVRHVLTNSRFLEVDPDRIVVASYFTVITQIGLDHHGRYRDTFEPIDGGWLIRHRFVSTDWSDPNSTMVDRSRPGPTT
jgi:SnoaL-like domain